MSIAGSPGKNGHATATMIRAAMRELPLHAVRNMAGNHFTEGAMQGLLAALGYQQQ